MGNTLFDWFLPPPTIDARGNPWAWWGQTWMLPERPMEFTCFGPIYIVLKRSGGSHGR